MRIENIQSTYSFGFSAPCIDSEEKEIMKRLLAYGVQPTGNKTTDKAKLRQIEEQKAKMETAPTNKYYTVKSSEIEKYIENRKNARNVDGNKSNTQKVNVEDRKGAQILGEYNKMRIKYKQQ